MMRRGLSRVSGNAVLLAVLLLCGFLGVLLRGKGDTRLRAGSLCWTCCNAGAAVSRICAVLRRPGLVIISPSDDLWRVGSQLGWIVAAVADTNHSAREVSVWLDHLVRLSEQARVGGREKCVVDR
jgi:hypothetical protein